MMTRTFRRTGLAALTALIVAAGTFAPAAGASPPAGLKATAISPAERITGDKAATSRLAKTDPDLLARSDSSAVQVMIKLDYDAVATYAGGIDGLAATSPSVTGVELTGSTAAEVAYKQYLKAKERKAVQAIEAVPGASVAGSVETVYGGIAATVLASSVEAILAIDGVVAVQYDKLNKILTDSSPEFVNAPAVYDDLGTTANAGEGVIYGNLDTGIWPEHPSFADLGNLSAPPGPDRECDYGDNPLTPAIDVFDCNNKLIGGAAFTATYDAVIGDDAFAGIARDGDGHGTHTSSTSAGNMVASAPIFGEDRGPIHGLAPGAWVMEYKVCGPQGCFGSDSAAAVQQAILDGVDVINFSISGGTDPFTDPVELAFLDAYAAGVFVSASAGNEGPGASTANHLSAWTTSVAASTQSRKWQSTLTLTSGGDSVDITGTAINPDGLAGDLPVVLASAAPYSDALCLNPAPAGLFTGKVVACQRSPGRVAKGFAVLQGGAAGMILYNGPGDLFPEMSDNHWLPTIHISNGPAMLAFLAAHAGATGTFTGGEATFVVGDVMSAFSSRGPAGLFIKPDVTAPGVQILGGNTPAPVNNQVAGGPPGELFQSIGGTSMSSPHVAGAGILLKAVHPDWSPGQIKSALMSTAITSVVKEDGVTPVDPFDVGGGRIDIGAAASASLTLNETAENFAALAGDGLTAVHVNIASINAPVLPGRLVTSREVTNVSGSRTRYDVSTQAPAGSSIVVSPDRFTLDAGESAELTVTISTSATIGAQQFGAIQIEARGGGTQHLPVAFIHTQGTVSLVQDCDADTLPMASVAQCEITAVNNSFDEQTVNLDTLTNAQLDIVDAVGAGVINAHHAQLHNVVLAGAQPGVPSVDPGTSPAGYLDLAGFGVPADPIGDEDIINYDVPAFMYNGQTWDVIGVDSNGYIVVGGGTAEDNNCCNIPSGPSPAAPNNMLAPFWTDLDGTGADGIRAATLTDGVNTWLVIQYGVNVFGTADLREFQVWIGLDSAQDITYTYAAPQAAPGAQGFLVGAENVVGDGDMEAVLPGADLRVTSTDPVPGDEVSYIVFVRGAKKGAGVVTTEMTADGVPGVTIVTSNIEVTNKAKK